MQDIDEMSNDAINLQVEGCEQGLKAMLCDTLKLSDCDASDLLNVLDTWLGWRIVQSNRIHGVTKQSQ